MLLKMPKDKIIDKLSKKEAKKNKDDEIEEDSEYEEKVKKNSSNKDEKKVKQVKKRLSNEKDEKDKEEKDKQDKKEKKFAGVEKGDSPNIETAFVKLHFNVNLTKKWMRQFYDKDSYKVKRKIKKDDESDKPLEIKVKLTNAHYAITASEEALCMKLVNIAFEKSKKGTAGLYTITLENMTDSVRLNKDFNYTFGKFLDNYDSHDNYESQLGLPKKSIMNFIDKFAFDGGNTSVTLDQGSYNLMMYLLIKNRNLLCDSAFQKTIYAKKTSVDDRGIMFSLKDVYTGELYKSLFKKVESVYNIVRHLTADKADKDDDSEKSPDKKVKTKEISKKTTKDGDNSEEDNESSDDEEEEDNESSEEEENEEEDDDEEDGEK